MDRAQTAPPSARSVQIPPRQPRPHVQFPAYTSRNRLQPIVQNIDVRIPIGRPIGTSPLAASAHDHRVTSIAASVGP